MTFKEHYMIQRVEVKGPGVTLDHFTSASSTYCFVSLQWYAMGWSTWTMNRLETQTNKGKGRIRG